jgi:probable F420-dependent oxidoreductase
MKFTTQLPGLNLYPPRTRGWEASLTAEDYQRLVRTIEELGFHQVTISEHIVMPTSMAELMGRRWSHALTAMAFVAGATSTLVVNSGVIVLPYHHPIVLAKAIATLDRLSSGRLWLSFGAGHLEAEFDTLGVPFHERGAVTDEYLAVMTELWTNDTPVFHGRYVDIEGMVFDPKPVQEPYPPILIGGNSRAAMRRAARYDGWSPWQITQEQLPECLDFIRSCPDYGDQSRPFEVVMGVAPLPVGEDHRPRADAPATPLPSGRQAMIDAIGHLQDLGVTITSVPMPMADSLQQHMADLQWFAEEVMPVFT